MIVFSKKSIHHWSFWRTKNKFLFCLTSGLFYSIFVFIGSVIIKTILGHSEQLFETSFYSSIGAFIGGSFLSIALWYENERRFKEWKAKEENK